MSNRLPGGGDENGHDESEQHTHMVIEDHLCQSCLWQSKCHIFAKIMDTFQALETDMFKDHTVNLEIMGVITHCPKYLPDPMLEEYDD